MKGEQNHKELAVLSSNPPLYIGLDVHKNNWRVSIRLNQMELKTFSQPPDPKALLGFLTKHFPGYNYYSCYEAGFCGFGIHRRLRDCGIRNIVVNPSDIPGTDKEKKRKSDALDCRKISRSLRNGELKGIYVPDEELHEERLLVRGRQRFLKDIKRIKKRIKPSFT
jgi:transposase